MKTENLDQAITDYLLWMIDQDYSCSTWSFYKRILKRYRKYVGDMDWETVFSMDAMAGFGRECGLVQFEPPIRGLTRYLYKKGEIAKSMDTKEVLLPEVYQRYLNYFKKTSQVCSLHVLNTRRVLVLFPQSFFDLRSCKNSLPAGRRQQRINGPGPCFTLPAFWDYAPKRSV